jgi:hypothetical protein
VQIHLFRLLPRGSFGNGKYGIGVHARLFLSTPFRQHAIHEGTRETRPSSGRHRNSLAFVEFNDAWGPED